MSNLPVIEIKTQSNTIISDELGVNQCICVFSANENIAKWEARAVLGSEIPPRGVGTLVESGGFLEELTDAQIIVDFNELQSGDGLYTIAIYAQDIYGNWSDGSFEVSFIGTKYNKSDSYNCGYKYNCANNKYKLE